MYPQNRWYDLAIEASYGQHLLFSMFNVGPHVPIYMTPKSAIFL